MPRLVLRGVDHTARPTWKLEETVRFYRDTLGLPLVHVISARGWGPSTHPDFLHFFFDSGNGSTIAFFYYLGEEQPATLEGRQGCRPWPQDHVFDATHTAWLVSSADELQAWRQRLDQQGLEVSVATTHEVIESVYVRDPNGYFIEFTRKLRPLGEVDAVDADMTLRAAIDAEQEAHATGRRVAHIDEIWTRKAALQSTSNAAPLQIFVPAVSEFATLLDAARKRDNCRVIEGSLHHVIEAHQPLEFGRQELGLKPAVWWGLFTGGVRGTIQHFDRDRVVIVPLAA